MDGYWCLGRSCCPGGRGGIVWSGGVVVPCSIAAKLETVPVLQGQGQGVSGREVGPEVRTVVDVERLVGSCRDLR